MARIRKPIQVTIDPKLVGELDTWLARQPLKVSRGSFIEQAIRRLLDELKKPDR